MSICKLFTVNLIIILIILLIELPFSTVTSTIANPLLPIQVRQNYKGKIESASIFIASFAL